MQALIQDRRLWVLPVLFWALLTGLSLFWNWQEVRHHQYELMTNQGRLIFTMVESIRLWNARHGGVYVEQSEATPPNPYLVIRERDIASPSGRPLTLINPAYMTRQLSGMVSELSGVELHLTSLKPLNPINAPRDWERLALHAFEENKELNEWTEIASVDDQQRFRFVAPLLTREVCMTCHANQGYQIGDIRGGISVSFPTAPILDPARPQLYNLIAIHIAAWLILAALTTFLLSRFRDHLWAMQQARDEQEELVDARTQELHIKAQQHQQTEKQLRLILSSSGEGIIALDAKGCFMLCNPASLKYLGYDNEVQLLGHHAREILCPSGKQQCRSCGDGCALHSSYTEGEHHHIEEAEFLRADGTLLSVEYRASAVKIDGHVVGSVITFSDISERKQRQEQIWHQANFDQLTGLNNRHFFLDILRQRIRSAKRYKKSFALLFIDLDGFKQINDELGHDAGDNLLQEVAKRLKQQTRESDTVARLGGDEFTVILTECHNEESATKVAQKIIQALAEPYVLKDQQKANISASIGIAIHPGHGKVCDSLINHADDAMYEAKRLGKNRFVVYSKDV